MTKVRPRTSGGRCPDPDRIRAETLTHRFGRPLVANLRECGLRDGRSPAHHLPTAVTPDRSEKWRSSWQMLLDRLVKRRSMDRAGSRFSYVRCARLARCVASSPSFRVSTLTAGTTDGVPSHSWRRVSPRKAWICVG